MRKEPTKMEVKQSPEHMFVEKVSLFGEKTVA